MQSIQPVTPVMMKPYPTYNGVKIRVNDPVVNTYQGTQDPFDRKNYNAVDIEVNRPRVNIDRPVYNYPVYNGMVPFDMTGLKPIQVPQLPIIPVAYQTNLISNKTMINADFTEPVKQAEVQKEPEKTFEVKPEAKPEVPTPNYTTPEAEKNLVFHGLKDVEIVKPADMKPEVDINDVIAKLGDKNFDVQAVQLEKIAQTAIEKPVEAIPYITTNVYSSLFDIIKYDSENLEKPSEKQIEIREKIIINYMVKEQAKQEGQEIKDKDLPFQISDEEFAEASKLSPFEQAERNKEYAILTTALLTDIYNEENKKEMGIYAPLTDLPGIAEFVDVLRKDKNPDLKLAVIDALIYIRKPEYKDELKEIFNLAAMDKSPKVAQRAVEASKAV